MKKSTILGMFLGFVMVVIPNISLAMDQAYPTTKPPVDVDPEGSNQCANITMNLRYGMTDAQSNNQVSMLQDFLNSNGFLKANTNGYFGIQTRQAVKDFQIKYKFGDSGFAGPLTLAKIKEIDCNGNNTLTTTTRPISNIAGCLPNQNFSSTTGEACFGTASANTNTSTTVAGCFGNQVFSSFTGQPCAGVTTSQSTVAGCNSMAGYSPVNGMACNGTNGITTTVATATTRPYIRPECQGQGAAGPATLANCYGTATTTQATIKPTFPAYTLPTTTRPVVSNYQNNNGCTHGSVFSSTTGQLCSNVSVNNNRGDGNGVLTRTGDRTPRIMYWGGKVSQHIDREGIWQTDPDGVSGSMLDKLTYCQKWYPGTTSIKPYKPEHIETWQERGNVNYWQATVMSEQCVDGGEIIDQQQATIKPTFPAHTLPTTTRPMVSNYQNNSGCTNGSMFSSTTGAPCSLIGGMQQVEAGNYDRVKITSVSPNVAKVGDRVVISGINFLPENTIAFVGSRGIPSQAEGGDSSKISPVEGEADFKNVALVNGQLSFIIPEIFTGTTEGNETITTKIVPGWYYIGIINNLGKSKVAYIQVTE